MRGILRFPLGFLLAAAAASAQAPAVRVADAPLVFTGQVFAPEPAPEARAEAEQAFDALGAALTAAGSDVPQIARLTIYAADDAAARQAEAVVWCRSRRSFGRSPITRRREGRLRRVSTASRRRSS
jgi:enamine deaminase RidA (YjgF/YER057c/UK114 family)